ncbi:thiaminase II [Deminuibacter soli]|uniref:Aminopyrimidine aminohydrolase n=1 Tax=Deminuibacter soli TaxID=2291815 RepID=A0A3E1NL18_9BACT|nr:thiaminase II [Deminuibacter soli]RFM28630.1 thiaminase II [Deminuibacter soli]
MKWSEQAWQAIESIYSKIIVHPFNQALCNGSLTEEKFSFYIAQDAVYLASFSRVLAMIAAKAHQSKQLLSFAQFASTAVVVEQSLHGNYFEKLQITAAQAAPACFQYTNYLQATVAFEPVETAMAAVLPCFWIYREVGLHIYRQQNGINNPYKNWIDTYAGEAFDAAVTEAIAICDAVAATLTPQQQAHMQQAFVTASRMEWLFWNSAWQMEQWAV